jgi:hypothetical protein
MDTARNTHRTDTRKVTKSPARSITIASAATGTNAEDNTAR